ncbi:MAG: hypothetical protein QOI55_2762 [Actinomycetota bacterium]|nr:hypothetical protein [Actinomycetota bacterium]
MTSTSLLPRTAARSDQLVAASQRTTLDPFSDVDWSVPIDDTAFHLPPEVLPLYGTDVWHDMSDVDRIAYSRHEMAALCGAGIWFENVLMQAVLRHLAELPVTDPAHRYLLIEVADECRHSAMFGEFIRRGGTPAYGPAIPPLNVEDLPGGRAMSYLLILAVEELLDYINRKTMRDDQVHSVSREIARLHVLEEARHVSFAKTYVAEAWPQLDDDTRRAIADAAPDLVAGIAGFSIDPAVYESLGIEGGAELAEVKPFLRAIVVAGLSKLTTFLADVGVIDEEHRAEWIELGLVEPVSV